MYLFSTFSFSFLILIFMRPHTKKKGTEGMSFVVWVPEIET